MNGELTAIRERWDRIMPWDVQANPDAAHEDVLFLLNHISALESERDSARAGWEHTTTELRSAHSHIDAYDATNAQLAKDLAVKNAALVTTAEQIAALTSDLAESNEIANSFAGDHLTDTAVILRLEAENARLTAERANIMQLLKIEGVVDLPKAVAWVMSCLKDAAETAAVREAERDSAYDELARVRDLLNQALAERDAARSILDARHGPQAPVPFPFIPEADDLPFPADAGLVQRSADHAQGVD